jgi:double-strand break repair protein MRE11
MSFNSIGGRGEEQVSSSLYREYLNTNSQKEKNDKADLPEESTLASLAIDNVKVEKLVKEFLNAQSLKILPQAPFGDAVSQFVDKDDKHAMEVFVDQSLEGQVKTLLSLDDNDEDLDSAMAQYAAELDKAFHEGTFKRKRIGKLKPRPDEWDSDFNGEWEDQPGAYELTDDDGSTPAPTSRRGRAATDDVNEDDDDDASVAAAPAKRAPAKRATAKAAPKKAPAKVPAKKAAPAVKKPAARGRPKANTGAFIDDSDEDVIMLDDEPEPTPAP